MKKIYKEKIRTIREIYCFIPVKIIFFLSALMVLLQLNVAKAQTYCTPVFSFSACAFGLNDFWITSTTFGTLNFTGGTCNAAAGSFQLMAATGNVTQGQTYTLTATRNGATYQDNISVWIDWDHSGSPFTGASEYVLNQTNAAAASNIFSASVTVPAAATIGLTRMRVMVNYFPGGSTLANTGCSPGDQSQGETKDFNITVLASAACSGTPVSLPVAPSAPSICLTVSTNIVLTPDASGYTYQWQQSNAAGGTYVNVVGGTNPTTSTYTTPIGSALPYFPTYYRCYVTCTASGITTASQVSTVSLSSFLNCYCTPTFAVANGAARGITNVTLNGSPTINNNSACNNVAPYYTLYTGASPVSNAGLIASTAYTLNVKVGSAATAQHRGAAWIDYNQNGVFETTEYLGTFGPLAANAIGTINFTVPAGAISGTTAMRVIGRFGTAGTVTNVQPCAAFAGTLAAGGSGECEDYRVIISANCTVPATQASGFVTDANPTTTSCSVKFTRGNGDGGMLVVCKAGSAPTAPTPGTAYGSPNANITGGGSTTAAGSFVIYNSNTPASGQVTLPATNLTPGITYYFAAYEWNAAGNCYNVTNPPNGTCVIPLCIQPTIQVSGLTVPTISNTTAIFNWTIGNGNKTLIILRQGSAVSGAPVLTTTYTDNLNFNFGSPAGSSLGSGNVMFGDAGANNAATATITGLLPSTQYYYSVYTYFSASHCYYLTSPLIGNFTTTSCSPTIQPTIPVILCATNTTMNLSFIRGNGNRAIVVARAGSVVNADPVYNTSYTANSVFGSGSQIGTGNFVVYDGNTTGTVIIPVTGLIAGTTYYFQIYEYNTSPNCYNIIAPATISSATNGGFYLSSTTTQNATNTAAGALAQDIVKLTIVTGGNLTQAVFLNSITFTTDGSTSVVADVTNAKVFYTGNSNVFSNATQFGNTFITNPAFLIVTGNFALLTGNNYFWIAYDVKSTAVGGHVLDATVTSFNISENGVSSDKTPTVTIPAGSRLIPLSGTCPIATPDPRCNFAGCNTSCCQGENITNITFGTTTSTAGYGCNSVTGYDDKTATNVFTVSEGSTYLLSETDAQWFSIGYQWCVWIDWNGNADLRDAGERYPSGTATISSFGSSSQSITIPIGVTTGNHTMRIWFQESSYPPDACPYRTTRAPLSTGIGQVIDVTIVVSNASGGAPSGGGAVSCATLAPSISTPIIYALNAAPSQLTATGTNLLWYSNATGGVGSSTAPTPSTSISGTTAYYVSQTNSVGLPVCEGPRTQIAIMVNAAPLPSAPVATATQPTCSTILTGSILLSGLPSSGSWTINPNSITGSGTTNLISPVAIGGPYSYTVTNAAGCISAASNVVTIVAGPVILAGHWVGGVSTDWNNPANWCDGVPTYTTDVTIPSSALTLFDPLIDLGAVAKCKNLTIKNSAILSIASNILDMKGDLIVEPLGIYDHSGGLLELSGIVTQTIPDITCYDLKINNSAGVIISGDVYVTNSLNLFSGIVSTGGSILHVTNPIQTAVYGFSNLNYINGRLIRYINTTDPFDFPIGDAVNYELATVTVNNLAPVQYLLGEYFSDNSFCSPIPNFGGGPFVNGSPITNILDAGFWTITPDNQPSSGTYDIQINESGASNNPGTAAYCAVIKRDDCFSLWQSLGIHNNATQSINSGVVTAVRTALTSFSDFGVGFGGSVLPIQLSNFTADYYDNNLNSILKWTTASELNCNYYDLEVSTELAHDGGFVFRKIGQVNGNGTSLISHDYSFVDRELNKAGTRYYRLKEVDINGEVSYSQIVSLMFGTEPVILSTLYPNPTNHFINYELISLGNNGAKISITNLLGQEMFAEQLKLKDGINKLNVNVETLPEGIYFINICPSGKTEIHHKFEKYTE